MANLVTAPVIPAIPLLKKQDYPHALADQDGLDKFFTLINPFFQQLGNALNGSLSIGNLNGEVISFPVTIPTPWVTIPAASLQNSWTTSAPAARYWIDNAGVVHLSGTLANGAAVTQPSIILPAGTLPIPDAALNFAAAAQINGGTTAPAIVQVTATGALELLSASVAVTSVQLLSLEGITYLPQTPKPGIATCWPKQVRLVGSGQPVDVWLSAVVDSNSASGGASTIPGFGPGEVAWQRVNTVQQTSVNMVQINNIAGLVPGRSYNVRCWVIYSGGSGAANSGVGQAQASAAGSNG